MSFLQPVLLYGLPLAALPILIHLINQRRFQNIDWGAMRFLLEANRMSRGFARIRQWLILLARALAVAALIFAVARPMARGRLGLMGGARAETTLILLDRSASMARRGPGNADSKIDTGVRQLASTLETLGSTRWVLIDSVSLKARELQSPRALVESAAVDATSASSDLPALLQAAHDYMQANRTGQAEIWICSDLRANDWNAADGQWPTLRDAFRELPQSVRFHLLAYSEAGAENIAIRASDVRRQETSNGAELLLSLELTRSGGLGQLDIPVQIEIEGARTEFVASMEGPELVLKDHPVPLDAEHVSGWGRISIPADVYPTDNEFYFVFSQPPDRQTVIVGEDLTAIWPMQLAATISPDSSVECEAVFIDPDQLDSIAWEDASLLIWHTSLPKPDEVRLIRSLVARGGQVLFLPPNRPSDEEFLGMSWTEWTELEDAVSVDGWRSDQDLLKRTQSGEALPVSKLSIRRYCGLKGDATALATLYNGDPLLVRAASPTGGVYFLTTTAAVSDSSLATNGVVMYAAIQRALLAGADSHSMSRQLIAGASPTSNAAWRPLSPTPNALSTEYPYYAGAYAAGDRTFAVNRSVTEDRAAVLDDDSVAKLFEGLDFDRVDDRAGNVNSLAREIWRLLLVGMLGAIVLEASLCMPRRPRLIGEIA